jgi:hypothetical protein
MEPDLMHIARTTGGAPVVFSREERERRIVIANLAKGTIGEQASNLLGSLLANPAAANRRSFTTSPWATSWQVRVSP